MRESRKKIFAPRRTRPAPIRGWAGPIGGVGATTVADRSWSDWRPAARPEHAVAAFCSGCGQAATAANGIAGRSPRGRRGDAECTGAAPGSRAAAAAVCGQRGGRRGVGSRRPRPFPAARPRPRGAANGLILKDKGAPCGRTGGHAAFAAAGGAGRPGPGPRLSVRMELSLTETGFHAVIIVVSDARVSPTSTSFRRSRIARVRIVRMDVSTIESVRGESVPPRSRKHGSRGTRPETVHRRFATRTWWCCWHTQVCNFATKCLRVTQTSID